jgi:hypothetical protein
VAPQISALNWAAAGINEVTQDQFSIRGDHLLTNRQRMFARYSWLKRRAAMDELTPGAYSYQGDSSDVGVDTRYFHSIAIDHTTTWTPSLVGSVRYGFSGRKSPLTRPNRLINPSSLGLPEVILRNQSVRGRSRRS